MVSTRRLIGKIQRKWVPKKVLSLEQHSDLGQWLENKKTPMSNFIRLSSAEERIAKVVGKSVRFGARIQLHQLASVPSNEKERRILAQVKKQFMPGKTPQTAEKRLLDLKAKAKVIQICTALRKALGGRDPTVFQILAVTALEYGLDSDELKQRSLAINNIQRGSTGGVPWEGAVGNINKALTFRFRNSGATLPSAIQSILYRRRDKPLDSKEICRRLRLDWKKYQIQINTSLQLLETMGLVKKFPTSAVVGGGLSVWMHRAFKNPVIKYPNVALDVLSRLSAVPVSKTELYKVKSAPRGKTAGSKNAKYGESSIRPVLKRLGAAGLINISRRRVVFQNRSGSTVEIKIALTPEGLKLMQQYRKTKKLPEALRKLLIGEKEI